MPTSDKELIADLLAALVAAEQALRDTSPFMRSHLWPGRQAAEWARAAIARAEARHDGA